MKQRDPGHESDPEAWAQALSRAEDHVRLEASVVPDSQRPLPGRGALAIMMGVAVAVAVAFVTPRLARSPTPGLSTGQQASDLTSTDKHNLALRATGESIARRLGNTLVAPVISVHKGNPETSASPGSIVLTPETFRAVIRDYATSLKTQGFRNIFIFGEDGGSQTQLETAAKEIAAEWGTSPARVAYIPEYYREDPWSCILLRQELNIQQQPLDYCSGGGGVIYHDDYHYSAIIATVAKEHIRAQQRRDAGLFSVNGVDLDPFETMAANGWKLIEHRTDITVRAIQKAMGGSTQAGG